MLLWSKNLTKHPETSQILVLLYLRKINIGQNLIFFGTFEVFNSLTHDWPLGDIYFWNHVGPFGMQYGVGVEWSRR